MKQYNISLVVDVPDTAANEGEIEEWIKYKVGYSGVIICSNPLDGYDLDASEIEIERH